jgi:glucoamylase
MLKVDTPSGPCWRRFEGDTFGEKADGSPYDGDGVGRAWPLLTGERGHYALLAGRLDEARGLLKTMADFANEGELLSEQIWDVQEIPDKHLHHGRPTGSAAPLVWAHAEYVKLARSVEQNKVFVLPSQAVDRYLRQTPPTPTPIWAFNNKISEIPGGRGLRIHLLDHATVHWGLNGWKDVQNSDTTDTGLGLYFADLDLSRLNKGDRVNFTFQWRGGRWEGKDFEIKIY